MQPVPWPPPCKSCYCTLDPKKDISKHTSIYNLQFDPGKDIRKHIITPSCMGSDAVYNTNDPEKDITNQ